MQARSLLLELPAEAIMITWPCSCGACKAAMIKAQMIQRPRVRVKVEQQRQQSNKGSKACSRATRCEDLLSRWAYDPRKECRARQAYKMFPQSNAGLCIHFAFFLEHMLP
eukprot:1155150-Pelagomonas_calceolata.AAC.9